ncbi:hypothetical protein JB92DRAFT_3095663 [Gautieria morchelliformis]|nr:hypothetical protein JB92DRAFT_3095663 [Gautieria morchelliformis]
MSKTECLGASVPTLPVHHSGRCARLWASQLSSFGENNLWNACATRLSERLRLVVTLQPSEIRQIAARRVGREVEERVEKLVMPSRDLMDRGTVATLLDEIPEDFLQHFRKFAVRPGISCPLLLPGEAVVFSVLEFRPSEYRFDEDHETGRRLGSALCGVQVTGSQKVMHDTPYTLQSPELAISPQTARTLAGVGPLSPGPSHAVC